MNLTDQEIVFMYRHGFKNDAVAQLTADRIEALTKERDEARAAVPALEATVRHLETVYSQAKRDRDTALDTHNRMLENVRGALGCEPGQGAVWKANELKKERDEARSAAHDTHTARAKWIRDVQEIRTHLGAYSHEDTFAAAKRVVRERYEACAASTRARNEASFQAAKSSALDSALRDIETDRDALRLRYDALFTQSIRLAREVDRLNSEKADRVEAAANLTNALDKARTALIKIAIESGHFAKLPAETRSCELCQGKERAPWPPAVGKGPTHHTCCPGEEASALLERALTGSK